jgi:hypothetical protein
MAGKKLKIWYDAAIDTSLSPALLVVAVQQPCVSARGIAQSGLPMTSGPALYSADRSKRRSASAQ